jgi:predicted permease
LTPTLIGFVLMVLAGVWLRGRRLDADADTAAAVLTAVVLEVTLPALTLDVLLQRALDPALVRVLVPSTLAQAAALVAAWALGRALGWSAPARGAAVLSAGFSNTAFLGFPLVRALWPADVRAAQAALLIDTWNTTALLWTLGAALAAAHGTQRARLDGGSPLLRPTSLAAIAGFGLNLLGVTAPEALAAVLRPVGACTSPLVFLTLGLRLNLGAVRDRWRPVAVVCGLRLLVAPAVALAACVALGLRGVPAVVAVLQSGMASALVGSLLVARSGCDAVLGTASVMATLLGSVLTLPLWLALAGRLLR